MSSPSDSVRESSSPPSTSRAAKENLGFAGLVVARALIVAAVKGLYTITRRFEAKQGG
jgi:hypothetical protein